MRRSLVTVVIIIVLLVAAGGIYAFLQRANESTDNALNTSNARQEGTEQVAQGSTPTPSTSTAAQTDEVAIENFAFSSATITVKKGTTVKWTNKDSTQHNVVSDNSGGPNGPLLKKGETYTFTFHTAGTFDYKCEPHPTMKGKVVVTE